MACYIDTGQETPAEDGVRLHWCLCHCSWDTFMLFDTESLNFSSRRCLLLWFRDWHTHADWNQCSETVEGK